MYLFYIKPYTDQYFTYYYMMSANWVSVKIMVPSECRPTGFLPTARPPPKRANKACRVCENVTRRLLCPSVATVDPPSVCHFAKIVNFFLCSQE